MPDQVADAGDNSLDASRDTDIGQSYEQDADIGNEQESDTQQEGPRYEAPDKLLLDQLRWLFQVLRWHQRAQHVD